MKVMFIRRISWSALHELSGVRDVIEHVSFGDIYGKRVIIIGGGAQVAQVAMGAVNEADRHNIRESG